MDICIQLCEIKVVVKYKTSEEGPWTALILKEKERRCGKQTDFDPGPWRMEALLIQ